MIKPTWIAADWGTSNLRVWAMDADDHVLSTNRSDEGMSGLSPSEFESALLGLIKPWLSDSTDVFACGMVGARQGWVEAPYAEVPCAPPQDRMVRAQVDTGGLRVWVIPGVKQTRKPDVMRGEETQISGFLTRHKDWDGVLCMPGTHTKWVHVSAGEVVSFQTFLTGEMFDLLSTQSVLRHSVTTSELDADVFDTAVRETLSRPAELAAGVFSIRATHLLQNTPPSQSRARLSGLLIGAEISAAKPYWLGQRIALVGAAKLSGLYARALASQGLNVDLADATEMTLAGLSAARQAHLLSIQ